MPLHYRDMDNKRSSPLHRAMGHQLRPACVACPCWDPKTSSLRELGELGHDGQNLLDLWYWIIVIKLASHVTGRTACPPVLTSDMRNWHGCCLVVRRWWISPAVDVEIKFRISLSYVYYKDLPINPLLRWLTSAKCQAHREKTTSEMKRKKCTRVKNLTCRSKWTIKIMTQSNLRLEMFSS